MRVFKLSCKEEIIILKVFSKDFLTTFKKTVTFEFFTSFQYTLLIFDNWFKDLIEARFWVLLKTWNFFVSFYIDSLKQQVYEI